MTANRSTESEFYAQNDRTIPDDEEASEAQAAYDDLWPLPEPWWADR